MKRPAFKAIAPALAVSALLLVALLAPSRGIFQFDPRLVACTGYGAGYGYSSGPPTVTKVDPVFGKTIGGTVVTISGTGFCGGGPVTGVTFGGVPATNVVVNSDTSLTATAPAHSKGLVDVIVTNQLGSSSPNPHSKFVYITNGVHEMDGWGGLHPDDSPAATGSAYWPGWYIAQTAAAWPGSAPGSVLQGFTLDKWGGLHPYGPAGLSETSGASGHYWPGWNIARDVVFLPDGTGGFVLDGWGGLHGFGVNGNPAPVAMGFQYWPGWDIARKVVIFADGTGGFTLDAWGGLHPFGVNAAPTVAASSIKQSAYWPGWKIARDVKLIPGNGGHSGYVEDGWGGLHPFFVITDIGSSMPPAITNFQYWPGWDIARELWFIPGSGTDGYTLDGWGGKHPFGNAPTINSYQYWPGWDIAAAMFGE